MCTLKIQSGMDSLKTLILPEEYYIWTCIYVFIDFLENNPDIEFKVLGKTVRAHVAIQITKIGNSDYFDIAKPITRQLI